MKKITLFIATLLFTAFNYSAQAVESHTVVCTAGNLATVAASYLTTVTDLTVTGTIDARDFKTMRDLMPLLAVIDLSGSTVSAYSGTEGTNGTTSVSYPANGIPDFAFWNTITYSTKASLHSFIYPSSVTIIGSFAFAYCSGLTGSLIIPSSVTTISEGAFYQCNGFTGSLTIPSSVTIIGKNAFGWCKGFTGSLIIPSSVTIIGDSSFDTCNGFTGSLTIPSSVTSIGEYAFYRLIGLTGSLTIPSSVVTLGNRAFGGCTSLTSIYASATTPINIGTSENVFLNANFSTCILHVPSGSKGLYAAAEQWRDFINIEDGTITSVNEISSFSITIFPNPATSNITVSELGSLVNDKTVTLSVSDVSGSTLFTQEVEPGVSALTIEVSSFKSGIYFMAIQTSNGRVVKRFIKE